MIFLYIFLGVLAVYFLYVVAVVSLMISRVFWVRGTDPENPCYVRFSDYKDCLERVPYRCGYYGKWIRGYIYSSKKEEIKRDKGFIILAHGFFGTHVQYLVDIKLLCEQGYQVLAFDQYGVGISDGKNQVSLSNGIYALENVIVDVEKRQVNGDLPIYLYGHSWGSYSIGGALKKHPEIQKAVLRSGPGSFMHLMSHLFKSFAKPVYYSVRPFFELALFIVIGGRRHVVNSNKYLKKNKSAKVLLMHAKDDQMVLYKDSQSSYFEKKPQDNIQIYVTEDGGHNTIITAKATENYQKAIKAWEEIEKIEEEDIKKREEEKFISSLSRVDMYPYREDVKERILSFLDEKNN